MLKFILTITLIIIAQNVKAQSPSNSYIEYYNLCNEGDKLFYKKDYLNAHKKYVEGFKKVTYPHCNHLVKMAKLSKKLKYFDQEENFSKEALLNGASPKTIIKNLSIKNKGFKDEVKIFTETHQKKLNLEYKLILDSLFYVDQKVIRGNNTVKGNYNFDYSKIPQNIYSLDDSIFHSLLNLIDKFGFPLEHNVGKRTFDNIQIIYHHNFRSPQNHKYFPIIENALKNGSCLPETFAWLYDQNKIINNTEPYFYFGVAPIKNLTLEEKKIINARRREYGIKPLEAYKIKQKKNWLFQNSVW